MKDSSAFKPFDWIVGLGRPLTNVVQVGANVGQELPAFERYGVDWAIMIEPLDEPFRELCERAAGNPRFIPVQALCSSREGIEYEYFVASNHGQSSSFLPPVGHRVEFPKVTFSNSTRLVSTTVDAVMGRVIAQHPGLSMEQFDTLLIDVQGAELKVLMGAPALIQNARQIIAEVSSELYEGAATLEQLQAFLGGFDFGLNFVRLSHIGTGDAIFMKRKT